VAATSAADAVAVAAAAAAAAVFLSTTSKVEGLWFRV
jgi:hypothetical protein